MQTNYAYIHILLNNSVVPLTHKQKVWLKVESANIFSQRLVVHLQGKHIVYIL